MATITKDGAFQDSVLRAVSQVCPGFRGLGRSHKTLKSYLVEGELAGVPVLAKVITHPHPMWRFYLQREIALYQYFARQPPPIAVPELVAADGEQGVLVLTRSPGRPLCQRRRAPRPIAAGELRALFDAVALLGSWPVPPVIEDTLEPTPLVRRELRVRLLEDPTAPIEWLSAGIDRCRRLSLVQPAEAAAMQRALSRYPVTSFGHGDLLLRNVLREDSRLLFVDWECAGRHAQDWDLALLWAGLQSPQDPLPVERIAEEIGARTDTAGAASSRWAAFLALAAFALLRELKFARPRSARVGDSARQEELRLRLRYVLRVLGLLEPIGE